MKKTLYLYAMLILLAGNLYCQDEGTEIKSLILAYDSDSSFDITLVKRINMGIPGGDNWLVEWTSNRQGEARRSNIIFVYVVNESKIIQEIRFPANFYISEYSNFDIVKDIPGMRLGEGSSVVYDYNNDGFDEIFNYSFLGRGYFIQVQGYDPEKKTVVNYAEIPFKIIDRERGPAPAEFIIYKGMKGFKVYLSEFEVAGGPGWVPDPDLRNGVWIFYAWDADQRRYVEIEEVEEEGIESAWPVIIEQEVVEWKWKPGEQQEEELMPEETSAIVSANSGKNTRSNLYIAIIAAVALAATVFIVVRRKTGK